MERDEIRLELVKTLFARRPDLDTETIVTMAKKFESYVLSPPQADSRPSPENPKLGKGKKSGNSIEDLS